ncbi:hypothetical protein [Dipodfec virus UA06Rod_12]|uniref:Uncharacterized protein n=1 Tax=Dipodfec virus UA06Rod_12 TaxID=2929316 RepID=A0A976N2D0_9VIRU|nr:hypothetical protein [Dipodfec virus UA06Rod_12]
MSKSLVESLNDSNLSPINTLSGISMPNSDYPTLYNEVSQTGDIVIKTVHLDENPRYSDYTLKSLISAGIDPASITFGDNTSNRLSAYIPLSDFADSLNNTDSNA